MVCTTLRATGSEDFFLPLMNTDAHGRESAGNKRQAGEPDERSATAEPRGI
jgi:hypothetical protein